MLSESPLVAVVRVVGQGGRGGANGDEWSVLAFFDHPFAPITFPFPFSASLDLRFLSLFGERRLNSEEARRFNEALVE